MKNHPDKSEIIRAASGLDKNSIIMEHVELCPECGKFMQDVSRMLAASDNSKISVSENVEHRIIDSYRNKKLNTGSSINRFSGFLNPAIAAFVIIALVAVSFFLYSSYYKDEDRKISYKGLYGDAYVNGVVFDEILISPGDKITTKSDSSSEMEIEKMFFINIYPESEIEVENSFYSKKDKLNVFNFKIISGTIYAKFEKSADLKYRFMTKDAKIESIGTEFLIEITKEGTTVIVTEGSLSVTSLKTGETKIAQTDTIFTVKDIIEVSDVDKSTEIEEQLHNENLSNKTDLQKAENKTSAPGKKLNSEAVNKSSETKNSNTEDKNETRKMMKEAKKEMNREMKGEMRKEMKKERGGPGK